MPLPTVINDVQLGQNTRVDLVSRTHGRSRLPLAEMFQFKPKKTAGIVSEFDDYRGVITYETFEGVDVSFGTTQADNTVKMAMIMDVDPNQPVIMDDPSTHTQLTACFVNFTGRNSGYKYGALYAEMLRASEDSASVTLKDPAKDALAFVGIWGAKFFGKNGQKCSIQYARLVDSPTFTTADDIAISGSTWTLPNTPVAYPKAGYGPSGTTLNIVSAFKNGQKMNIDSTLGTVDISVTGTTVTPAVAAVSGDVWDFFYLAQI